VLAATSRARVGDGAVTSTLVLERGVRGTIVRRERLAFDTRFAAAAAGRPERAGHVFVVARGRVTLAGDAPIDAPVAFVLADDEIERVTQTSRTFRSDGERVDVVHLRFGAAELAAPVGLGAGPLALTPRCWDAAARVLDEPSALAGVLDALAAAGVVRRALAIHDEPERFRRLWSALAPLYQAHGGAASLKQLAASLGMSMRQVGRDAKQLAAEFGLGGGYRDSLLVLRLRVAVLLLSAPRATIADVATAAGYGSAIAMARAFRDARLPAPSVVQAAVTGE
jgi:AraC-like DNA-binding protein